MPDVSPQTVAIIGAGFSGTATAVHLLRAAAGRPLRLILIERAAEMGRGAAYARTDHPYLLNVPASRMSASTADPVEFLRFAQHRFQAASGDDFLTRTLYGDYLQDLLHGVIADTPDNIQVEQLRAEVVDLEMASGQRATLRTADGRTIAADYVVLALGNPAPCLPRNLRCTVEGPAVKTNPWTLGRTSGDSGPILIIGTGLTMIDVATAKLLENPKIVLHAISRHGLLPPSQTTFRPDALDGDGGLLASSSGSVSKLVAAARRLGQEAIVRGGDWREVVTLLRRHVPALWASLPSTERARFLRHVRTYWDVHRHRVPGQTLAVLDEARKAGRLSVHAGRLQELEETLNGVRARWITRGTQLVRSLDVAEVINCTGPDYSVVRSREPLWKALLARGLMLPDDLQLGIRTGGNGGVARSDGTISDRLFYVGPMLRADQWAATAVAELRTHAERLASHLVGQF